VKGGREGTDITEVLLGSNDGRVVINYDMENIPDQLDVYYGGELVQSTQKLVSHEGSLIWEYEADSDIGYSCTMVVRAPTKGTIWKYSVSCPK
jgi:hypothetical protein